MKVPDKIPNLAQKSVVVTGGASGIGLAIVRFFASQRSNVAVLDVNESAGAALVKALSLEFSEALFLFGKCDISNWENQKLVFNQIYQEFGSIDIVIANAGITEKGSFLAKSDDEPQKPSLQTVDVNLNGTLYTINLAVHYMRKNPNVSKGSIVCTASNAGLYPLPIAPMYATSKHAVVGAVRSLARPLESEGLQINAIAPAVIATNIAGDSKLFESMVLTPVSTAVAAIEAFMSAPHLTGVVAEVHGESVTYRPPPEYVDKDTEKNIEMFWTLGYA